MALNRNFVFVISFNIPVDATDWSARFNQTAVVGVRRLTMITAH